MVMDCEVLCTRAPTKKKIEEQYNTEENIYIQIIRTLICEA
jgi:hypothetical protein